MKNKSLDVYFEKMRRLSDLDKKSPQKNETATLVEHVKLIDGTSLGIVKEAHKYHIKISKNNSGMLTETHFNYMNGIENMNDYAFPSLNVAQKQLSLIQNSINESIKLKKRLYSKKTMLNEDVDDDLNQIENLSSDIDTIKSGQNYSEDDFYHDNEEIKKELGSFDDDTSIEHPDSEDDDEVEIGDDGEIEDEDEIGDDNSDIDIKDIESAIGKLTYNIRNIELTPEQIKSYVNSLLSSFNDKFDELDVEDRKLMASKILQSDDDNSTGEEDVVEEGFKGNINEGTFTLFLYDEYGYYKNLTDLEVALAIESYFENYEYISNDDLREISKFATDGVIEELYDMGLSDIASEIESNKGLNEVSFGGLKRAGSKIGDKISNKVGDIGKVLKAKYVDTSNKMKDFGNQIAKEYHKGSANDALKQIESIASEIGVVILKLNDAVKKAGEEPINIGSLLTTLGNNIIQGKPVDLSKKMYENYDEFGLDDDDEINEISFGGLKRAGSKIGDKISNKVSNMSGDIKRKYMETTNKVKDFGNQIAMEYHKGSANSIIKEIENMGSELGLIIKKLNNAMVKAGDEPINVGLLVTTIKNKIKAGKSVDLSSKMYESRKRSFNKLNEDEEIELMDDELNDDELDDEMGGVDVKINEPSITDVDLDDKSSFNGSIKIPNISLNINKDDMKISISEAKLRKYIYEYIDNKVKGRKTRINEGRQSMKIMKLNRYIDLKLKELQK